MGTFLTRKAVGRRSNAYLSCQQLMGPNKKCAVCGTAIVIVTLDTKVCTLEFLVTKVLKGAQGFVVPNVSFGAQELVFGTEEDFDDDNGALLFRLFLFLHHCSNCFGGFGPLL